jgi:hypothetical protein
MRRALGTLVFALAAGCTCSPFGLEDGGRVFKCADDPDCPHGQVCIDGQCGTSGVGGGTSGSGGGTSASGGGVEGLGGGIVSTGGGGGTNATGGGTDAGCTTNLEDCTDGIDNNCNGQTDCQDPACGGLRCDTSLPLTCFGPLCTCTDGGTSHESACSDGKDNDCDKLVDCADPDCANQPCNATGSRCSGMSCSCSPTEAAETHCTDTIDNDCDGLADCADPDCNNVPCGSMTGFFCQLSSKTCHCDGRGGASQATESSCGDSYDNDCDGKTDCQDTDCNGASCGGNGKTCSAMVCTCSGNGGTAQTTESTCNDQHDNDCNGQTDCADSACNGLGCGANGKICAMNLCVCGGNGGPPQASETACDDMHDNDCDGLTDCADSDCNGQRCGPFGRACAGGTCQCSGNGGTPQGFTETTCDDMHDNDCDGLTDCADTDCAGQSCGKFGMICQGTNCVCSGNGGTPQTVETTTCADGFDNDCDGQIDCLDGSCLTHECNSTNQNFRCCQQGPGGCVNVRNASNNCGGCGIQCPEGVCQQGACECTQMCPPQQLCQGNTCKCATAAECAPYQMCQAGACVYQGQ